MNEVMKYIPINGWTKETMIEHIKKEFKGKSVSDNILFSAKTNCFYRSPEGRKCVVGMFIPDDKYKKGMEAAGPVTILLELYPKLYQYMPLHLKGLAPLQVVHDESDPENTLNYILTWIENNIE